MDEPYDDLYDEPKDNNEKIKNKELFYKEPQYNDISIAVEENDEEEPHSLYDLVHGGYPVQPTIERNGYPVVIRRRINRKPFWTTQRLNYLGGAILYIGVAMIVICLAIIYTIGAKKYDDKFPKTTGKILYTSSSVCEIPTFCRTMNAGFEYRIYDGGRIQNTLTESCTSQGCIDSFVNKWNTGKLFDIRYEKKNPNKYKIGHQYEYSVGKTTQTFVIIGGFMFAIGVIIIIR